MYQLGLAGPAFFVIFLIFALQWAWPALHRFGTPYVGARYRLCHTFQPSNRFENDKTNPPPYQCHI